MEKITVEVIGKDGNIFNILGIVSKAMKQEEELKSQVNEMTSRVFNSSSYEEALSIMSEYVDLA